ncbi:uncharacterized protein LOC120005952 [Tripterygium wilfordii]|uniref:uncharacterized protein LOC120005952 n=1 Tax=Tripterygium wilfordii TaxID=458696 RepID=UPI0018F841EE|nr:uncharacterized protein LOC120005952 [Tripterygium wilfordii]
MGDSGEEGEKNMRKVKRREKKKKRKTREDIIKWTLDTGKRNGIVTVIISFGGDDVTKKGRILFGCERSGHYRSGGRQNNVEDNKNKRFTGSKKCNCPFRLRAEKSIYDDGWMLMIVCGAHNHSAIKYFEGHSFIGRLNKEEVVLVVDMSKSLTSPKDSLTMLKDRDPFNSTTLRTIYNVRHRNKVLQKAGRSQM